jgi:hypothetical protein
MVRTTGSSNQSTHCLNKEEYVKLARTCHNVYVWGTHDHDYRWHGIDVCRMEIRTSTKAMDKEILKKLFGGDDNDGGL